MFGDIKSEFGTDVSDYSETECSYSPRTDDENDDEKENERFREKELYEVLKRSSNEKSSNTMTEKALTVNTLQCALFF